jgi:DNA-directed RNA polymerase specialized sigma24 family protein
MSREQLQTQKEGQPEPARAKGHSVDPDRWLDEYGDELFSFTMLRVRDRGTAQDLMQETFLAALKAKQNFAGRSTERAWLFGISAEQTSRPLLERLSGSAVIAE